MSQKHDKGTQKRNRRTEPVTKTAPINGERLAAQLVARGLASRLILESFRPAPRKDYDA